MSDNVKKDLSNEDPKLTEELIWVRSMIRVFAKLEGKLRNELGYNGVSKIALKENYYLLLLGFSFVITVLGVLLFLKSGNILYLATAIFPTGSWIYLNKQIKEYKEKNIFRLLGKIKSPPEKLILLTEEFIFKERDYFEDIIKWQAKKSKNFPEEKFAHLFQGTHWTEMDKAQNQCLHLAILMVSLQKYLHKNKKYYLEYVKKLPVMNEIEQEGYRKVKHKQVQNSDSDGGELQTFTFGGGFGFTKES
jgi:hypothetical protein